MIDNKTSEFDLDETKSRRQYFTQMPFIRCLNIILLKSLTSV